eukprot:GHRR01017240.1.p1 GENE.GHRR01017240.1~~GHRR01017240.1.p1  ORF type:complete len:200 (+),score=75.37 GHRR01017240.1:483-1082(+)
MFMCDLQVLVKGTGERCYYPNTRLITLPVINLTRSSAKTEKVVFLLDVGRAGLAAKEALLERIREHYEENESDFATCPSVNFVNILDPYKVQLQINWTYNFAADEFKRTSNAKTALLSAVQNCLGDLPELQYTMIKEAIKPKAAAVNSVGDYRSDADGQRHERAASAVLQVEQQPQEQSSKGVMTTTTAVMGVGAVLGC